MQTVLIVFGGMSSEHEVSLRSAKDIIENIPKDLYHIELLGITKKGKWLYYNGNINLLPSGEWEYSNDATPACLLPSSQTSKIAVFFPDGMKQIDFNVAFPVLHGKNGEDGTIQGLFQLYGIPFVGSDARASAVCMDKALSNTIANTHHIPQAKWTAITQTDYQTQKDAFLEMSIEKLSFPIFVKPANAGSSVGVGKARNQDELCKCIDIAFKEDYKIVLEECIVGQEVECSVLGNEDTITGVVGEIGLNTDFYDYDTKYVDDTAVLHIPALISEEKQAEVQTLAKKVFAMFECSGLSRVDFFVRQSDGAVLFNEINTLPGFTSISMYAKMLGAAGIDYSLLLEKLITLAIEKWHKE